MYSALFAKALKARGGLRLKTNAFRLINGRADNFPGMTVDCFNRHFLIQLYRARPSLDIRQLTDYIQQHFSPDYLIIKNRALRADECMDTAEVLINRQDSKTMVTENGFRFLVDLNDAVNPGLFLDMRANRMLVAAKARHGSVLNCFAYTCAFGVYCLGQGATRVVNVDISKKALTWGQTNYSLNSLPIDKESFVYSDCLKYLKGARKWNNCFDMIILDPPSFSRYESRTFSIKKSLASLIDHAQATLNPKGKLLVATNCSDIACRDLETLVRQSSRQHKQKLMTCRQLGQDVDFPHQGNMKESHLAAILVELG